jgi:hypothetical protein
MSTRCTCITCRRPKASSCLVSVLARRDGREQLRQLLGGASLLQNLAVADHDHQQVVEVVGDVAGEPADRFDALHLTEVTLVLAQLAGGAGALELRGDAVSVRARVFLGEGRAGRAADRRMLPGTPARNRQGGGLL